LYLNETSRVKNIVWVGSSRMDLTAFPREVKEVIGFALYQAQIGLKAPSAKPLRGFGGAGILEIVENFQTDTYRTVYAVKFSELIYVLHAFQKKSKKGVATRKADIGLVKRRLRAAEEHYTLSQATKARKR
jgi:phage-related protein